MTVAVTATDLREFGLALIAEALANRSEEKEETYLSPDEAAEKVGVTPITLWRWEKKGVLPRIKIGNKVRYRLSDVQKMMEGK